MVTYRKTCVEFLCEIPSIKCTSNGISQTTTETPYVFPLHVHRENEETESNIEIVLTESVYDIKESSQICRRKAREVLVWLLSDSDRQWHPEMPNSVPIAYVMKGYSLSTNIMRSMHDNILEVCSSYGINVICSCFDGQWVKLGTRNGENKPMTLLQLQEHVWEKAKKTSREHILNAFVSYRSSGKLKPI
ncbi:unnamed protein product [Mytilus coruscus]|uniref:Uncharacterized protein n=1 Tax=Mytilus coruscus TaxID=42192 RepID=A0A6J8BXP6_MYTCO|nr:unnamed protein product [Mytilus coruscus]